MSLIPKEQDVKKYLENKGVDYKEGTTIVAYYMPSRGSSTAKAMKMKFMMLNFSENGIAMIGMNKITNKLEADQFSVLLKEDIHKVSIKKGILQHRLTIQSTDGTLELNVNKKILGAKWQKQNVKRIVAAIQSM